MRTWYFFPFISSSAVPRSTRHTSPRESQGKNVLNLRKYVRVLAIGADLGPPEQIYKISGFLRFFLHSLKKTNTKAEFVKYKTPSEHQRHPSIHILAGVLAQGWLHPGRRYISHSCNWTSRHRCIKTLQSYSGHQRSDRQDRRLQRPSWN